MPFRGFHFYVFLRISKERNSVRRAMRTCSCARNRLPDEQNGASCVCLAAIDGTPVPLQTSSPLAPPFLFSALRGSFFRRPLAPPLPFVPNKKQVRSMFGLVFRCFYPRSLTVADASEPLCSPIAYVTVTRACTYQVFLSARFSTEISLSPCCTLSNEAGAEAFLSAVHS